MKTDKKSPVQWLKPYLAEPKRMINEYTRRVLSLSLLKDQPGDSEKKLWLKNSTRKAVPVITTVLAFLMLFTFDPFWVEERPMPEDLKKLLC